jgi:hypothetical protein
MSSACIAVSGRCPRHFWRYIFTSRSTHVSARERSPLILQSHSPSTMCHLFPPPASIGAHAAAPARQQERQLLRDESWSPRLFRCGAELERKSTPTPSKPWRARPGRPGALARSMNDVACENFSTANATALVDYTNANAYVGLLAFWAVGRDGNYAYLNIFKMFH